MRITISSSIKKIFLLFLVFAGLFYAKEFLMPLSVGAVVAMLFLPLSRWMESKKISRSLAVLICLLIILLIFALVNYLLVWQISSFVRDFDLIKEKAIEKGTYIQIYILDHLGIALEKQSQILKTEQPSLTSIMQVIAGSVRYIFINFVLILAYICLLLYYRNHIMLFIVRLTPADKSDEMSQIIHNITQVAQKYLLGLAKMIVLLWIMYSIGFGIIGVRNFIFFAIVCGFLEIIPFIGNITGTILTISVAAVNGADTTLLFGIVIVYALVQFVQTWLFEPLVLGPQVKINPLFTIIALVLGEIVWGIPGIILAIPITAMFKIVCDHIESLKPFGFLIGEIESKKNGQSLIEKLRGIFR
ncbi:AI-2E family transporter [Aurantibacillus circumpalustris]|uniref:AI-2E family transporter n=1 Tax=Aurantibacillus circumpalustris TaxID=3036359 RepID=UPI00295A6E0B|nr:AI-2E family transporter [Aurantibacillus circumpalustris]